MEDKLEPELNPFSSVPTMTLLVTGLSSAGKTTFIRNVSTVGFLSTENAPAARNLPPMDVGYIDVEQNLRLCLYGTRGQMRFDFMWQTLIEGMLGVLVIVDSADTTAFKEVKQALNAFLSNRLPCIIIANKQDLSDAVSPDDLRKALELPLSIPIFPCIALETTRAKQALTDSINYISQKS
jgi:uncharacterized protein